MSSILAKRCRLVCSHPSKTWSMTYSTLKELPKTQSFTKKLDAEPSIPSKADAFKISEDAKSPEAANFIRRRILPAGAFSFSIPQERKEYKFLLASNAALDTLGLPESEADNPEFQKIVSGEDYKSNGYFPYSQAYAGWQFGQFAGQLGDGRVVNLFEVRGDDGQRYELQLKGSGLTPFSRFADGKALLSSSIREFVISEALHAIGIPSTRALAITFLPQTRAMRSGMEQCAVVCRMAQTWVRIGTFDLYRMRNDRDGIRKLSEYVIDEVLHNEFADFAKDAPKDKFGSLTRFDKMYLEIVRRNASTVAKWQVYGFLNGVLNTDNTSIIGLSMDFGPFAFMDRFDPEYTSNHDDHDLRYSYKETPTSIFWNLSRLGEDLAELIGAGEKLVDDPEFISKGVVEEAKQQEVLTRCTEMIKAAHEMYQRLFLHEYYELMSKRLGLTERLKTDEDEIIFTLLDALKKVKLDYNKFFVILQNLKLEGHENDLKALAKIFVPPNYKETINTNVDEEEIVERISEWLGKFIARLQKANITDQQRLDIASKVNPILIPRNWMLQEVINYTEDNDGDTKYLRKFLQMATNPYDASKWGQTDKDLESRWLGEVIDDRLLMSKCSCAS